MTTGADQGATLFLAAMQIMLGVLAGVFVFLGAFDVSCPVDCQHGLKGVAIQLMFGVAIVVPFVSIVVTGCAAIAKPTPATGGSLSQGWV